jgi:hypothetical protein
MSDLVDETMTLDLTKQDNNFRIELPEIHDENDNFESLVISSSTLGTIETATGSLSTDLMSYN